MSDQTDVTVDDAVDDTDPSADPADTPSGQTAADAEVTAADVSDADPAVDTDAPGDAGADAGTGDTAPTSETDGNPAETETPASDVPGDVARERDEYLAALRQVQADFENFRKQALRRQGDAIEHATGRLVEDLLVVLDACDAGIEHGDEGVTAIFTSLLGVLEKAGLERLDPVGEPFDPNAHEAVMHEPADDDADVDGPTVAEVLRPGYRWKERTLRAAMVKVRG